MFKLILIVFQSCKFKGNMSPRKASMEGEMKNLEESVVVCRWWLFVVGGCLSSVVVCRQWLFVVSGCLSS